MTENTRGDRGCCGWCSKAGAIVEIEAAYPSGGQLRLEHVLSCADCVEPLAERYRGMGGVIAHRPKPSSSPLKESCDWKQQVTKTAALGPFFEHKLLELRTAKAPIFTGVCRCGASLTVVGGKLPEHIMPRAGEQCRFSSRKIVYKRNGVLWPEES